MIIVKLESENVKRLRAVSITPTGALVTITGNNEQGKSSVLDSIAYALGGTRLCPPKVIRNGEDHAEVSVDLGEFIVTRKWTPSGSTLSVKSRDGAPYPSPQKVLDGLVGKLSFDPLAFSRATPAEQVETLRKLVGLDFAKIDKERAIAYEARSVVNRDVTNLKGSLNRMPSVEAPDEPVVVAELLAQQDAALAQQRARENAEHKARLAYTAAEAAKGNIGICQQEAAALEKKLGETLDRLEAAEKASMKAASDHLAAQEAAKAMPVPDLAPIRAQLENAEGINAKVRAKHARAAEALKVGAKEKESAALTKKIDKLDEEKAATLAATEFPVPGLGFDDAGVTLDGLPLEQASSAARLKVSLGIGIALNPKLKVLLIRDGSLLDGKSLAAVGAMAEKAGAQVWLEMVGTEGAAGIVIEDGSVVGAKAEAA